MGSCTMKHNPRLNERIVQLPGIDRIHPLQPEHQIQGLLAIFYEMQEMLAHCSGMDQVTLQPVAGAQGEFTAIRCIQEYHRSLGESERTEVIVPDSAHGTNPASATMCGCSVVEIPDIVLSVAAGSVTAVAAAEAAAAKAMQDVMDAIAADVNAAIDAGDLDLAIAKFNEAAVTIPECGL